MTIVVGGDSFTWGSELADSAIPYNNETNEPARQVVSQSTFTALLAKELGLEYHCVAYPGFANGAIRRTVMDACEKSDHVDLVFVCWSFPSRYEFRFAYNTGERWGNWYNVTPWSILDDIDDMKKEFRADNDAVLQNHIEHLERAKRTGTSDFAKAFYKHVGGSGAWELWSSYTEIVLLQQYLQLKNIPYIFTTVDECLIGNMQHWHDDSLKVLHSQIDQSRWIWFPDSRGFFTWARDEKYPFGTTHPLESAHRDAFLHIKENYHGMVAPYYTKN